MNHEIRPMVIEDYDLVHALWASSEGLCLGEEDNADGIALYLKRNAGLCFVALRGAEIVGAVLSGHDGRRGILRHLAVKRECRNQGLGRLLVRRCMDALAAAGIKKCNVFVMDHNPSGLEFWEHLGFQYLDDDYRTLQLGTDGLPASGGT